VLALDLERYDYTRGSSSLIRATEGTIVERLPPRMKIREGASLELPHILVLIDDPSRTVIEPVGAAKAGLEKLYDFDLMLESGHLAGYAVSEFVEVHVVEALRGLAKPETFATKYGIGEDQPVLLFAMGDGNHSLATAKAIWEKIKAQAGMDHPARYALPLRPFEEGYVRGDESFLRDSPTGRRCRRDGADADSAHGGQVIGLVGGRDFRDRDARQSQPAGRDDPLLDPS
jgi:hypothetical protein